jgi:type I restriction enzyme M protein
MPPRRKQSSPQLTNTIADLMKSLWEAAVKLRGSIEPADYKRYVLPIIFLRFLSLRYEKRREELSRKVAEPGSDYFIADPAELKAFLEDPDEYAAAGTFAIPEDARWCNIVARAQQDDIKTYLDEVLELLEVTYPDHLRGLLPRIYAGSNLEVESVRGLINLFAREIFAQDHEGTDLIGRVYEYFIGEFASSEGKRGGEYFTPVSIVRTLVTMLEPRRGIVFDPCCGSGGMFVQSDLFTHHNRELSFYGQESKEFTYRLCRMNLFIHGLNGDIRQGNSYTNDQHATLKADFIIANPPFNDGAKSDTGWGASNINADDARLELGRDRMPLASRNANTMWILHFLSHLGETGLAGFVMATGELSNSETARATVRRALVEADVVDCIVQLSGQLFANTQIPCALWFLAKNRGGAGGYRRRAGEILFIDARQLGTLMPGSRTQKTLTDEEITRIAAAYQLFKRMAPPEDVPGFSRVATLDEVRGHNYVLTPGRYVGAADAEEDEEAFEEQFPRLLAELETQMTDAARLDAAIRTALAPIRTLLAEGER